MMLEGMKVVEVATHVAVPAACAMLAEWGADVIKLEPLAGDRGRRSISTMSKSLESYASVDINNRGKRAVAVDLGTPEGHEAAMRLADWADCWVTNMLPRRLKRFHVDWPDLHARNPRLVYLSLTGYGRTGPAAERPGVDIAAFWSRSGLIGMMAPEGQSPTPPRMAMGDRIAGLGVVGGVLAAYIEAQRTGKGRLVETSLLRAGIYTAGTDVSLQLTNGRIGSIKPREQNRNPFNGFYRSGDGHWLAVSLGWDGAKVANALGHPEFADDPAFATFEARRAHSEAVVAMLDRAFAEYTRDELGARFDAAGLIAAPVQSAAEVVADAQAEAAGAWTEVPGPRDDGATYRGVAMPVSFFDEDGRRAERARSRAPHIGEHTDEVLAGLGFSAAETAAMRASRAVV